VTGIVHPGVDLEQFNTNLEPIDKDVFNRHEFVVLFAGRFVESKGIYDLIDAFEKLPTAYHLYIIGRGDQDEVEERISGSTIENSVTIEGSVDHELLPQYYAAADIVCSPTHYDSFCMVNIEAMACGTPVITTDIEGVAEYAIDRETALLVPPKNSEELSNAVLELSTSPALQKKLKEQGRSMVAQFSWENSARELMDIYEKVDS
jgi:D-inositol-3-phosphate glycosyltransferase